MTDFTKILQLLSDHRVEFIIIGGAQLLFMVAAV